MNRRVIRLSLCCMFIFWMAFISIASATEFSGGLLLGYNGGPGLQLNGKVGQFAEGLPLQMSFTAAYSRVDPGKAWEARSIFINDNTNGDPQKSGRFWDLRLDFMYPIRWLSIKQLYVFGGPRYALFNAHFNFVGGNEVFDITGNQWGWGLGLISYFPMTRKFDFVLSGGTDYYFASTLTGHDTAYSPDGEDINARRDYKYADADAAINQPRFKLKLMFGLNYHF